MLDDETEVEVAPGVVWSLLNAADVLKQESLTPQDSAHLETYWNTLLDRFDKISVQSFIRTRLQNVSPYDWQERDVRIFAAVGAGTGGYGQDFQTSMVDFIRYDLWAYEDLFRWGPTHTSSEFAEAFLRLSYPDGTNDPHVIMKPAFNIRLRQSPLPQTVLIDYDNPDGSGTTTAEFDYVIVATSNPAMVTPLGFDQNSSLEAGVRKPFSAAGNNLDNATVYFGKTIRESLRHVMFYPSTKIWAVTSSGYLSGINWPKVGDDPVRWVISDRLLGQTAFFPNDKGYTTVLLTYQNGFDATRYAALPVDVPGNNAPLGNTPVGQMTAGYIGMSVFEPGNPLNTPDFGQLLHDSLVEHYVPGSQQYVFSWHDQPYFQGAFRLLIPGQYNYNAALAFQYTVAHKDSGVNDLHKRVFLAGESAFFLDGWIEGPLYTGVNCTTAVLYRILGDVAGEDPAQLRTKDLVNPAIVWKFRKDVPNFWNDSMTS